MTDIVMSADSTLSGSKRIITCQRCGAMVVGNYNQKYCEECRPIVDEENSRRAREVRKLKSKSPKTQKAIRKQNMKDIRKISREAVACGMSYGEYVARRMG